MNYVVFKSVFIGSSDFADQSHVPGFAICFVQTSAAQTFRLPAAQWQKARDYAGKGQHLCWSDHLAGVRDTPLPRYRPHRSSVVDCSANASLSLMIHEIDDWWCPYTPPEQASARPDCAIFHMPSVNGSDLPTAHRWILLSCMRVRMS